MRGLVAKELRGYRVSVLGWGLGLAIYAVMVVLMYPSMAEQLSKFEMPEVYKVLGDFGDFSSLEGFVGAELFQFLIPLGLAVFALIAGSGALAGEEDAGTLELLLALPVSRAQVVLAKALAFGLALAGVLAIQIAGLLLGLAVVQGQATPTVGLDNFIWAVLAGWPLVFLVGMLALWLGAYLPSRKQAVAAAGFLTLASYLINNLAGLSDFLSAAQPFAPHHYYSGSSFLRFGVVWGDMGILLAGGVGLLGLAVWCFQRRNVTVAAWPWDRARPSREAVSAGAGTV